MRECWRKYGEMMDGLWRVGRSGGGFGGVERGIAVAALVFVYSEAVVVKTSWAGLVLVASVGRSR